MNAREAREKAFENAERDSRYKLSQQLIRDEKAIESAITDAIRHGYLHAYVEIKFDLYVKYDSGNIPCHIGEFHSQAEYVKRLFHPYVADGYKIKLVREAGYRTPLEDVKKDMLGLTTNFDISW